MRQEVACDRRGVLWQHIEKEEKKRKEKKRKEKKRKEKKRKDDAVRRSI